MLWNLGVPNFHTEGIGQHSVRTGAKVSNGLDWLRGSTAWAADSDAAGGESAVSTAWCEMPLRAERRILFMYVYVAGTKKPWLNLFHTKSVAKKDFSHPVLVIFGQKWCQKCHVRRSLSWRVMILAEGRSPTVPLHRKKHGRFRCGSVRMAAGLVASLSWRLSALGTVGTIYCIIYYTLYCTVCVYMLYNVIYHTCRDRLIDRNRSIDLSKSKWRHFLSQLRFAKGKRTLSWQWAAMLDRQPPPCTEWHRDPGAESVLAARRFPDVHRKLRTAFVAWSSYSTKIL